MDQAVSDCSRAKERLERIVAALGSGVILVDSDGQIVWMDRRTRARLNGGIDQLAATLRSLDTAGNIDCSISPADVTINGTAATVCLIREGSSQKDEGYDLASAFEAALTDTSWFTRTIMEKLKALRQTKQPTVRSSDLHLLTDREREVLGLICEGRSDVEMGTMLNVSQNTVRNHIASLYRKIGVNRRSAAIIWARERAITAQDALALGRRRRAHPSHPLK
jgi:DNA-binding NarL/FixJ family response regulator